MTEFLAVLLVLSLGAVAIGTREVASTVAVTVSAAVAALYPSFSAGSTNTTLAVLGPLALLTIAFFRPVENPDARRPPFTLMIFLIVSAIANARDLADSQMVGVLAQGAMLVMLAAVASRSTARTRNALLLTLCFLVVVQFVVATGEEFLNTGALWPRANGTDNIFDRPNYFTDAIAGRALGTTGMMITLGAFCGVGLIVAMWKYVQTRKLKWLVLVALAAVTIFYSGTRSAVIATAAGIVTWMILSVNSRRIAGLVVVAAIGAIVALTVNLPGLLGFGDDFESTDSFAHRNGVIGSFNTVLAQGTGVIFGQGNLGALHLLVTELSGADGIAAFDNTFVRELAVSGVVGFALMIAAFAIGIFRGSKMTKVYTVFFIAMGFSFDLFTWRLMLVLFVLALSGALDPGKAVVSEKPIDTRPRRVGGQVGTTRRTQVRAEAPRPIVGSRALRPNAQYRRLPRS